MGDAADKVQFYRLVRQHPQGPMVMPIGDRAAGDSNQMGGLGSGQGLAVALLSLVMEDCLQPSFGIPLTNPHDRIATDIKGGT